MAKWRLGKGSVLVGGYLCVLFFLIYKKFLRFVVCCTFDEKGNKKLLKNKNKNKKKKEFAYVQWNWCDSNLLLCQLNVLFLIH